MFEKRTDLALEVRELRGEESGIAVSEQNSGGIKITEAVVAEGDGEKNSGKPAGVYTTLDIGSAWRESREGFSNTANILASRISLLLPQGEGTVLVAGLGNWEITPDSIGPRTVKGLLVTRHIKSIDSALFESAGFKSLAATATGVLSQTGVETAEQIKSICDAVKPKCVVAVDALAARRLTRLCTTVQLSNGGIAPGSGVANRRSAINSKLLGVPVIALGVPTVVDAATLACDILEENSGAFGGDTEKKLEGMLGSAWRDSFVAPKEIDMLARRISSLLATALNIAVHQMPAEQINDFIF
ncbi:MAG: GPR endopeptidase [Clostridia bacterium]|nr:GPR endopeptidase [Clostridia bacterium]